jgi:hypothetical protein
MRCGDAAWVNRRKVKAFQRRTIVATSRRQDATAVEFLISSVHGLGPRRIEARGLPADHVPPPGRDR